MGYYIHDVNGYVADGPSLRGWKELREAVLESHGGPATKEFVRDGATEQVEALASELAILSAPAGPIATSLEALVAAVDRCAEVVILGTGVDDSES